VNDDHVDAQALTAGLLGAAGTLTAAIQQGVVARGFTDIRPAHGFVFARISWGGATVGQLADHLGVTRQAASQLVEDLVGKGYVERRPDPSDARVRVVTLTDLGRACTVAAEAAAVDALRPWVERIGAERLRALTADLAAYAGSAPLRPAW
jgi:DNA-binding MarR family transcriptional regulator